MGVDRYPPNGSVPRTLDARVFASVLTFLQTIRALGGLDAGSARARRGLDAGSTRARRGLDDDDTLAQ